jgi:DNA-binding NtrC family response regulator
VGNIGFSFDAEKLRPPLTQARVQHELSNGDHMEKPVILMLDSLQNSELKKELRSIFESAAEYMFFEGNFDTRPDQISARSDKWDLPVSPNLILLLLETESPLEVEGAFEWIKKTFPAIPVLVIPPVVETEYIRWLLGRGAIDFVSLPLTAAEILPRVWKLLEMRRGAKASAMDRPAQASMPNLIGKSPRFVQEMEKVPAIAGCHASVFISGETGTGKEVIARAIHSMSPRCQKPFIPLNCGAIPNDLLENEMFGHERGAYTGAGSRQIGLIQEAHEGTLFLDEVDSLPISSQVKLLRFLQEREYRPLGATRTYKADVRILAASNADLEQAVTRGKLRWDFYYRLKVLSIHLPPLRERSDDIPLLANFFVRKYADIYDKGIGALSEYAIEELKLHQWPGNVRELEHVIERAVILCNDSVISTYHLDIQNSGTGKSTKSFHQMKAEMIATFEKNYLHKVLREHDGNIARAARSASKNRRAFWELLRKHNISAGDFKV